MAYPLDPGPFALDDRLELLPAPAWPSFGGLAADGLSNQPALVGVVQASAAAIGGVTGDHVGGVYDGTIGDAPDALGSAIDDASSSPAGQLMDAGGRVDYRAAQVGPYLPDADAGVQMGFVSPPDAPQPGDPGAPGLVNPPPDNQTPQV